MKARSRYWKKDSRSEYTQRSRGISRVNAKIFLTFGDWSVHPSADIMWWWVCLLKVAQSYWAHPHQSTISSFLPSTSHILFLAVSLVLNSALRLCRWALAWEQHDSPPPYTSTPSLSATICPTLASHHSFPPSKPINTPLSLSTGTLAHMPATAAISLRVTHLSSSAMFYAL